MRYEREKERVNQREKKKLKKLKERMGEFERDGGLRDLKEREDRVSEEREREKSK